MPIDRKHLLQIFPIENLPACHTGMELAGHFLEACFRGVERLDEGDADRDRFAFNARWRELVEHRSQCDLCNEV